MLTGIAYYKLQLSQPFILLVYHEAPNQPTIVNSSSRNDYFLISLQEKVIYFYMPMTDYKI
jgi:hypothetical protein